MAVFPGQFNRLIRTIRWPEAEGRRKILALRRLRYLTPGDLLNGSPQEEVVNELQVNIQDPLAERALSVDLLLPASCRADNREDCGA